MPGFYRDAIAAMFTEPEPAPAEESEPPAGRVDVIEDPRHADFAYEAHRIATEFPCGTCSCPGCYGCTDPGEDCDCGSKDNAPRLWPDENEERKA